MKYDFFKNKLFRKTLASWCAFATLVTMCGPAWAVSGALDSGSAVLSQTSSNVGGSIGGTTGTFKLETGNAGVLDWAKLSLNSGETLNYNSAGSFYNVVSSAGGMSTIAGAINGTDGANVYIFNPNGIMFNSGASVNVGGVFGALATGLTGLPTSSTDWTDPASSFNKSLVDGSWAAVPAATMTGDVTVNGGTINAAQTVLSGLDVSTAEGATFNNYSDEKKNKVLLAAGDKVAIDGFGGGTITLAIPDTAWEGDVDMLGQFANDLEAMAAGNVRAANGALTVGGDLTVNTFGDVDVQPGAFVVNNAEVSAKSIDVTARGEISVVGKTDMKTTAGDLKLVSQNGQFNVLGTASGDAATIQATGGDLTISAVQGVVIGEHGVVAATKKADNTKGDVTLTSTDKDVLSDDGIQIAGADAKVSADNGITLMAGDGNITIKDGAEIEALSASKTLAITATKGAIGEDASSKVTAKGATVLTAAATEDITLEGTENDFQGVVAADGAKVSLKDKNSIRLGDITARKTLQVDAGQDITVDNAQVLSAEEMTLTAGGTFEAKNGAVVKTGAIDESTDPITIGDPRNMTIDAATVKINSGAKVGASGDATVTADAVTVNAAKLAAGGTMAIDMKTTDGAGAVTIQNGAVVAAKGALTVGGTKKPATLTVEGTDTKFVAAGALTANAGKITAQNNAKVASDDALTLKTTEGALVVQSGAKVLAAKTLALDAKTDMFIDNATVAGKDEVSLTAAGTVMAMNNATVTAGEIDEATLTVGEAKALTIDAAKVVINSGAKVGASGDATVIADAVTVDNAKLAAGGTMAIDMKTTDGAGAVTIRNGAVVAAKGALTVGGTKKPATLTVDNAQLVSEGSLAANAGKITVQKNAKIASDKALTLTATDGAINVTEGAKVLAKGDGIGPSWKNAVTLEAAKGSVDVSGENTLVQTKYGGALITAKDNVKVSDKAQIDVAGTLAVKAGDKTAESGIAITDGGTLVKAGSDVDLTAAKGDVVLTAAKIQSGAGVYMTASERDVKVNGTIEDFSSTLKAEKDVMIGAGADISGYSHSIEANKVTIEGGAEITGTADENVAIDLIATGTDGSVIVKGTETLLKAKDGGTLQVTSTKDALIQDGATLDGVGVNVNATGNAEVSGGAKVLASGQLDVTAGSAFEAKGANTVVKVGAIDEATDPITIGDPRNMTIDAATVKINSGAKVGASGDATVTADAVTVNAAKLAAGGTMAIDMKTTDGAGAVTIQNGAVVAAKGALTVGGTKKPATLTVEGTDTKLVAAGALTANAGKITAQNNAKVASDDALTLKTTDGALVVQSGAKVLAAKKISLDAKTDMFIDNATVAGKDEVSLTAARTVMAMNNATVTAGENLTLDAETITVKSGAGIVASGDVKASAKYTNVNGGNLAADKNVIIDAKAEGEGTVIFENGAVVYARETLAVGGEKKPDRIKIGDATVSADKNVRLAAAGETTINSAVAAGKHLTVIGKNVRQNADLATTDGSVYVQATGGDIVMKAGTRTTAKRTTTPNPHTGEGNVLYTATGDVRAEAGGATISADPAHNDGAIVLYSEGGSIGENMTLKAARTGMAAKGDVKTTLYGDVKIGIQSLYGSIELEHVGPGTLTVDKSMINPDDKVIRVNSATIDPKTTELPLSDYVSVEGKGLEAATFVDVKGHDGSTVVIHAEAGVLAHNGDASVTVDGDITVNGTVNANNDATLTAGKDVTVNGTVAAGSDANLDAGKDIVLDAATLRIDGNFKATAQGGKIEQKNGGYVMVVKESNLKASGDVNLQNWRNDFQGKVNATANDGNVRICDGVNDILVGTVVAGKNAVFQSNVQGGKVIANGETSMTANSVSLNSQRGDVSVTGGATLTGEADVSLTAGSDITVGGEGSTLAGKEITVYTENGNVVIEDQATLMAGKAAYLTAAKDLTIRKDAVVIVRGKDLEAGEKALTVEALEGSITIDDTTGVNETLITAKGDVEMTAKKDVVISGGEATGNVQIDSYADLAVRARTGKIEVRNASVSGVKDLALTADKGDVTAGGLAALSAGQDVKVTAAEGAVTLAGFVQTEAGRDAVVKAKKDVSVQDGAKVFASRHLTADATEGELTVGESAKASALSNVRLAAAGDTTVDSKVTAGKNLTIIGKNVAQNADLLANDGSVYVEATGGDIVMKAGTVTTAKKSVAGTDEGQGNIFYTAKGDVRAEAGGATISADPAHNDGAVVLYSETGSIGENMTLKAARSGMAAKGDVKMHLVGDVKIGVTSLEGSITINHEGGTMTVDKSMISDTDKAVKVLSVTETELIGMKGKVGETKGLDAATFVDVTGHDGSSVVVDSDAGIIAHNGDASVTVDRDIAVDGYVDASKNALLKAEGNVAVNGSVKAVEYAKLDAGKDVSVNGTVTAGNDATLTADRDAMVNGTVAAGHDTRMFAGRDVTVRGTVNAGRDAATHAGRNVTVSGVVEAGNDQTVSARSNLSTPGAGKLVAGRDLFVNVGSSTPMINVAVGRGVSARSGERALAFRTVGGNPYPEVYGNDFKTAVFIDGRVAGGNSADFSILQGYEQVAAFGNVQLTPLFAYLANFNPLGTFIDAQAPGAAFAQANMTSDKGEIDE